MFVSAANRTMDLLFVYKADYFSISRENIAFSRQLPVHVQHTLEYGPVTTR